MAASFHGFRSLIENSPDAISLIDRQGAILYGSASTTRIFGYTPDELVGRNWFEMVHPEDRAAATGKLQALLGNTPLSLQWDARVRHKDGSYCWVESIVSNLLSEREVQAIVVQQRNINERRAAEVETQRHAEELASSNLRLEEFAYTAAHDLKEPLRAISSYTQLLLRNVEMDANAKEMAGYIVDGALRMAALIDGLLSFASTGMLEKPRRVDLRHALSQAKLNLAMELAASGAVLTSGPLPVVQSNEIVLVRLFQNLISNAVKYRSKRPVEIHVSTARRGRDLVVSVKDNGAGMRVEDHARAFMPFVRLTGRDVPGTGLGLAVCKKIVEAAGGSIWVESELGAGSTFFFTIPSAKKEYRIPTMAHTA